MTVIGILQSYTAGYSDHDVGRLGALFTPGVTRHGLRAGGCSDTQGRQQVLQTYTEQFSEGTGSYRFTDLSPSRITVSGASATADLMYEIAASGGGHSTGSISFTLKKLGGGWLIQHIVASC